MAQSGWRLPDELLKRVRVRAAEDGVRQNAWVVRALESALEFEERLPQPPVSDAEVARRAAKAAADARSMAPTPRAVPSVQRGSSDALARQARLNKEKGL